MWDWSAEVKARLCSIRKILQACQCLESKQGGHGRIKYRSQCEVSELCNDDERDVRDAKSHEGKDAGRDGEASEKRMRNEAAGAGR